MDNNNKIGIIFHKFEADNWTSGGHKVNFLVVKAFYELGYRIDLLCKESTVQNHEYIENIIIDENMEDLYSEKIKENNYAFTVSASFFAETDYMFVHEHSRKFRTYTVRSKFENFIAVLFAHKRFKKILKQIKEDKRKIKATKKIIVPSEFLKEDLIDVEESAKDKTFVLYPSINEVKQYNKQNQDIYTFGLVARGFEVKGGFEFINALFSLKLLGYKFKAKIITLAQKKFFINFLISLFGLKKMVQFIDFQQDINSFYEQIDCLVMSSKRESFGMVAAEAALRKIPVILNTRCGIKELFKDGESAFIYDYKDNIIGKLAEKMIKAMKKEYSEEFLEKAHQSVSNLTYDNFKLDLKKIIEEKV